MLHFTGEQKPWQQSEIFCNGRDQIPVPIDSIATKCTLNSTMSEIRKKVAISAHSLTRKERLSLLWWLEFTELEASHPNLKLSKYLNML